MKPCQIFHSTGFDVSAVCVQFGQRNALQHDAQSSERSKAFAPPLKGMRTKQLHGSNASVCTNRHPLQFGHFSESDAQTHPNT
eukprot:3241906-Amphidinium_carterae.1